MADATEMDLAQNRAIDKLSRATEKLNKQMADVQDQLVKLQAVTAKIAARPTYTPISDPVPRPVSFVDWLFRRFR